MMKKPLAAMAALAALATLAGCTSDDGGNPQQDDQTESAAPAAPEVVNGQPIEFELTAPEGTEVVDGADRADPLSENHISYIYSVADGVLTEAVLVTSYATDQAIAAGDFESLLAAVSEYDTDRGFEAQPAQYRHAIVNGMPGVHRYLESEVDGTAVKEYNHYLASGSHMIQITCRWSEYYADVMAACRSIEETFPVPEGWEPQL